MTTPIATDTELSAVNSILGSIGQSPITQLKDTTTGALISTNPEISFIFNLLVETTKDVLNEGWHFNSEEHIKISPDVNKHISIPTNMLRYDIHDGQITRNLDVVKREGKLYDKVNHTFEFTNDVEIDATYLYDFEDIPSAFQRYIIAKASTRAATQLVGDANLAKLLQNQEAITRAIVMEYDTQQGDPSFFGFRENQGYNAYQPYKALIR
jgi:hypothetical protein